MKQVTMEWINEKVGMLYLSNLQIHEEVQRLAIENAELKKKYETPKEGTILDE